MTNSQKLSVRLSEIRQRLNEVAGLEGEAYTAEIRAENDKLQTEYRDLEGKYRAAVIAEGDAEKRALESGARCRAAGAPLELRGKRVPGGPICERHSLAGGWMDPSARCNRRPRIGDGDAPGAVGHRPAPARAPGRLGSTAAPGTVGINLDRIRPAVFAQSILPRLGVEMPRVESGTYASATISASLTAGSHAKGAAAQASAATFTVQSVTPKRISARLGIRIEDVAAVGQQNFEGILRENLSLVLSDALDSQGLNGAGAGSDLVGIFERLTTPADPGDVADFDAFAAAHAGGIEGLWALTLKDVASCVRPCIPTRLAAQDVPDSGTNYKGELSAAAYAERETGGFWTSISGCRRLPQPFNRPFCTARAGACLAVPGP